MIDIMLFQFINDSFRTISIDTVKSKMLEMKIPFPTDLFDLTSVFKSFDSVPIKEKMFEMKMSFSTELFNLASISKSFDSTSIEMYYLALVIIALVIASVLLILKMPKTAVPVPGIPMVPNSHWFLGHTQILIRDFRETWWKLCYEHANEDGLCSFWHFNRPAVTVNTVEHARAVLNNSNIKPRMDHMRKHLKMILGESSVIWFIGKEWRYHRNFYTKGLNNKPLAAMLQPIRDVASSLVKALHDKIYEDSKSGRLTMDVTKVIQMAIFDVSGKVFFGMDFKCSENLKQSPFSEKAIFVEEDMMRRIASPLNPAARFYGFPCAQNRKYMESIQYIRSNLQRMIHKRRLELASSPSDADNDFIATLLKAIAEEEAEKSKTLQQIDDLIIDTLLTAHMASFDSSSITLVYILYSLASNPEAEQRCLEEIEAYFKSNPDEMNPDDFAYCNAVITETIRLYPANVAIGRTLDKPLKLGNTVIPEGNDVLIPYWYIMRDERHFARALEFLPERWVKRSNAGSWVQHSTTNDNYVGAAKAKDETESQADFSSDDDESTVPGCNPCDKLDQVSTITDRDAVPAASKLGFIGFSVGARNCVGLKLARKEICIILVELLRNFKFEVVPGFKVNPKTIGVGLKHNGDVPLIISNRI